MAASLRVGVIGAGHIGKHHVRGLQEVDRAAVTAICDTRRDRAEELAAEAVGSEVFTDFEEMLRTAPVDAVTVALPPYLHAPVTIASLEAGKHVLCEKPMALNAEEARSMVETARRVGRRLMVFYRLRYSPEARVGTRIAMEGHLGRVYHVRCVDHRFRGRPVVDNPRLAEWFMSRELSGGGVVADLLGYSLDLVLGVLGFPHISSVCAATYREIDLDRQRDLGNEVEEFAAALLRSWAADLTVFVEHATAANACDACHCTEFLGSEGGMTLQPLTITRADADGARVVEQVDVSEQTGPHPHQIGPPAQFVNAILDDEPFEICSGYEGYLVQRLIDAIYRSAETGEQVRLQEPALQPEGT